MRKEHKRLLSFITACAVMLSFPFSVFAEEYDISPVDIETVTEEVSVGDDDPHVEEAEISESDNLLTDSAEFGAATVASGNCGAQGDNVRWMLDSEGTLTIIGTGAMADYTVSWNGRSYSNDSPFFSYLSKIKTINVKKGVVSVGNYAFCGGKSYSSAPYYENKSIQSITLSDTVVSIGDGAFIRLGSLTDVILPEKVDKIGDQAFMSCIEVKHITFPKEIDYIGDEAFAYCSKIEDEINLPDIKHIGASAFFESSGIKNVTLSSNTEYVGAEAFRSCKDIEKVVISNDIIGEIGSAVFSFCKKLTDIQLPNDRPIPGSIFWGCEGLQSVVIPEGVTEIGMSAFRCCYALGSVIIPKSVNVSDIKNEAFLSCSLTHIHIPYGTTYLDYAARGDLPLNEEYYFPQYANGGCSDPDCPFGMYTPAVEAESVSLDETSLTMEIGEQKTLTASVLPEDTTDNVVKWTTSNDKIATVSNGEVTAVAAGEAVIAATTNNGKFAVCNVTINAPVIEATGISLDKSNVEMTVGETNTLKATISPSDATDKTVIWTSDNETAAVVSDGLVTAKSAGTAVITAETSNGKAAVCIVTVKEPVIPVTNISLNVSSMTLEVGETGTLTATVKPDDATDKTVTWTSSNTAVATISSGIVTAKKAGTARITATSSNGKTAVCAVAVKDPVIPATGISLSKTALTLEIGKTSTLTATISPSNATDKTVTWASSDTTVATVSGGIVNAKKAGTAAITVTTSNGKTAICIVTVKDPVIPVTGVSLNEANIVIETGTTITLTATVSPANATDKTITWMSSDPSIADVTDGIVIAKSAGTAAVTAVSSNGKTAVCIVTVKDPVIPVTGIMLDMTALLLEVGSTKTITATITPDDATDGTIVWTSSDTSVAMVSNGIVLAKSKGISVITATTSNGKTASCVVTVKDSAPAKPTVIVKTAFGGKTVQFNCANKDAVIYYSYGSSNITTFSKHVKAGETVFIDKPMATAIFYKAYLNGRWSATNKQGLNNVRIAEPLLIQSGKKANNDFKIYTQTKDSYIIYTLDGTKPSIEEGTQKLKVTNGRIIWGTSGIVNIPKGKTIKAIAIRNGLVTSEVMTYSNK